jgi:predicted alpha/beta superfamily hydrolase
MLIRVTYPVAEGQLRLRTDHDWDVDLKPVRVDGNTSVFDVHFTAPTQAMKPVLITGTALQWAKGPNYVLSEYEPDPDIWPFFYADTRGHISAMQHVTFEGLTLAVRIYYPAGYDENTLRRFPVLYMQDGSNLFFPDEAFQGNDWRVDETMDRLDQMNAIRKTVVIGISTTDRLRDYTKPGYDAYGRFVVQHLKPLIDARVRTRTSPHETAVMGSSLGGVAALYLAWQYPQVFGRAGCLSSTFGMMDDLFARIATEPKRDIVVYLDSGWPRDNFDATNAMRDLLMERGYQLGVDLLQFSFPEGRHHEDSWAARLHLPFQFFFGRSWCAHRSARRVHP